MKGRLIPLFATVGLPSALAFLSAALIWLWLAPYPWPVNPSPYPWPTNPYAWWVRWLAAALALGLISFASSELPLVRSTRAWMERRALLLVGAGMAFVFIYGWASALVRFISFDPFPGSTELAWYGSLCWNTWQGRIYEWMLGHFLAVHVSLVPALLLPLCPPGVGMPGYLLGQSLLFVLPALPLFLLARQHLAPFPSLLLAWAYLVLPGIFSQHSAGAKESSSIALPLACAFLFYRQQRLRPFLVAITLGALAIKEYYAPVFGLFGLLAWRDRRSLPWVIGPWWVALLSTTLAYGVILPFFRQAFPSPHADPYFWGFTSSYGHLGDSPQAIVGRLLSDPVGLLAAVLDRPQLLFLYELLLPFLFVLPWGAPEVLFALWELMISLPARSDYVLLLGGGHAALASTALLAGTMGSLGWLSRASGSSQALVRSLAAAVLALSAASPVTVASALHPIHQVRQPRAALAEAVALVPPDVPVAAPPGVLPHLVNRPDVYYLWGLREDLVNATLAAVIFYEPPGQLAEDWEVDLLRALRQHASYRLAYERDGVSLFLRDSPGS